MNVRGLMMAALCCFVVSPGLWATNTADPGRPRQFSAKVLDQVVAGKTTKAQVEALLGQPWRTTFPSDPQDPTPEVWEYRGQDASGTYRVHIEFDGHNVVSLVSKIPDKTGQAPAKVAKTPPGSGPHKN